MTDVQPSHAMAAMSGLATPRMIGVVIPAYGRSDLLLAAIASILAQTRLPDDIVVVDDGSPEPLSPILAPFAPRVRCIRIENSRDLTARNRGLAVIATDLVAFCDSDDVWHPEFLARMEEFWTWIPDLPAAYGNFRIVREGIWEDEDKFAAAPADYWRGLRSLGGDHAVFDAPICDRLLQFQALFPSAMVVDRKRFVAQGQWDDATKIKRAMGGDFATALRVGMLAPLGILRAPLVGVRRHPRNIASDAQKTNLGEALVLEHVLETRPEMAVFRTEIEASIIERRQNALAVAFARGDFPAVREIAAVLPEFARHGAIRLKLAIARLPPPLGAMAAVLTLRIGSLRSRLGADAVPGSDRRGSALPTALIAVGTPITERPPHRTVRAEFPHTAPTLDV